MIAEGNVVRGIRKTHRRLPAVKQPSNGRGVSRVGACQAMVAERPEIARLGAWCGTGGLQGGVEVERFRPVPLIPGVEGLEELGDFVFGKPRQREVDVGLKAEVCEKAGEQLVVELAGDVVE